MGEIANIGDEVVYRQEDGEITAWLTGFEEKMELGHTGSTGYRRVFHLLVVIGLVYLVAVFAMH